MKSFLFITTIFLTSLFQVGFLSEIAFYGIVPNICLMVIIAYLLLDSDDNALWWIAISGFLLELFSPYPFGVYLTEYVAAYFIIRYLVRPYLHEPSPLFAAVVFFLLSLIYNSVQMILLRLPLYFTLPLISALETAIGVFVYRFVLRRLWRKDSLMRASHEPKKITF